MKYSHKKRRLVSRWDEVNCQLIVRYYTIYLGSLRVIDFTSPILCKNEQDARLKGMRASKPSYYGGGFIKEASRIYLQLSKDLI